MEDMSNSTEYLRERFAELQAAYKGDVVLHLASESILDNWLKITKYDELKLQIIQIKKRFIIKFLSI